MRLLDSLLPRNLRGLDRGDLARILLARITLTQRHAAIFRVRFPTWLDRTWADSCRESFDLAAFPALGRL